MAPPSARGSWQGLWWEEMPDPSLQGLHGRSRAQVRQGFVTRKGWQQQQQLWEVTVAV